MDHRTAQTLTRVLHWTCCTYIAWVTYVVKTRVPVFGSLFAGLGMGVVPRTATTLVALCKGPAPLVAGGAVILFLILKEVFIESRAVRALTTMLVFMAVSWFLQWVGLVLLQPLYLTLDRIGG